MNFLCVTKLQFLLVRAGSTDLDIQNRILGSLDVPLSQSGVQEIEATSNELRQHKINAIYTSAGLAARQTGKILSRNGNIKLRVAEKLTNLDCGLWHGKSIDELKETQPTLFRQWKDHPEFVLPPQGEPLSHVRERVAALLSKICRKHKSGMIVIVAPNPLLGIIRCEIESKPLSESHQQATKCGGWELVDLLEPVA
jgi:broad specificity phosphatase PhoE